MRAFANASAPQIFVLGVALYAVVGISNDPCPKVTDNGATKVFEGGCTTQDGQTVSGSAVVERAPTCRPPKR